MLKKNLFKSCVSAAFQTKAPVCGWNLGLLDSNEKEISNSPLSTWQHVFSCPFALHRRSSHPCATGVSEHDETLWNIAAPMWQSSTYFLHMVMKLILTQQWCGQCWEWQTDNAMCWTGYCLGKRCYTFIPNQPSASWPVACETMQISNDET